MHLFQEEQGGSGGKEFLRPSFITMPVIAPLHASLMRPNDSQFNARKFRSGRLNAASGPRDQEAEKGMNRNWVSCSCSLAEPVFGDMLEIEHLIADIKGRTYLLE